MGNSHRLARARGAGGGRVGGVSASRCRPSAPDGREQRIGGAFDEADESVDERSCDAREKERGGEADEAAGEDIERVVRSDEHASRADYGGCGEKDGADYPVEEENGECDPEGSARVIAREGGVVRAAAPDVSGWVRGERALALPDLADRLVDQEREGRRTERAGGGELPLATTAGSGEQPEGEGRRRSLARPTFRAR